MSNEYIEARKEYVERVRRELLGPGSEVSIPDAEHELLSSSPNVRYSIGILFPQKQRLVKENDDATDEETVTENEVAAVEDDSRQPRSGGSTSADTGADSEEESLDEQIGLAMQNLPSSMGYSFFAKGNCDRLVFRLSFATYDNSRMEDCAYPVPEEVPEDYILPTAAGSYVKYDAKYKYQHIRSLT